MGAFETGKTKDEVLGLVKPFLTQMAATPAGSADTGGGSMAAKNDSGLIAVGGAALLGAAGAAVYANHRRPSTEDAE